ncbi:hypothetical protein PPF1_85 [Rhizobium phage vB_RleM_PPF1]|uniref:hypothetical protein n=1 Tax=Rhizobium phage vB_RleM_PPF1 TaxID=1498228 RepID=UPI00049A3B62|nr:hypothetical protein PPF1_85 [Rhizobium phage vB_RleM_PPF1]AID18398.1 hypothetical protein PPF1_85 [Rhizobium phage vB_RleM_PPF1]
MSIELGNWFVPLLVTIVAFGLAASLVRVDAPDYSRLVNRLLNLLLIAVAAIASLFVWFAWAMVVR